MFLELIKSMIFGIVQGITEWLPISSTGHLILLNQIMPLKCSENFYNFFLVFIQLGSILAVIFLYFKKLNPFYPSKTKQEKQKTLLLWSKVIVGSIPVMIVGLLLNDFVDKYFHNCWVIAAMLILYGILFLKVEKSHKSSKYHTLDNISYKTALKIGCFQSLALIPGTSRSGSTILGGIFLGASRPVAAEFSFFLSIPAMFGASFLKIIKYGLNFTAMEYLILITAFVVTFFVSVFAIGFLMNYIKKHDFQMFGKYRIVLGVIIVLFFVIKFLVDAEFKIENMLFF